MNIVIPAAVLLHKISELASEIQILCVLDTLKETDDLTQITVDNVISFNGLTITLCSEVILDEDNGMTVCSGVDQNTENTSLHIACADDMTFELDGETYTADELCALNDFHEAVLATQLSDLSMDTVDGLLKQILPCYAVSA